MKRLGNILLFCLVVVISAVATFWFVNRDGQPYPSAESHLQSKRLAQIPGETAEEKFQSILGRVTADVAGRVKEYKKERLILPHIASPHNLKTPEYIAENNALMQDAAKSLRADIVEVMGVFDAADEDIEALVYGLDAAAQEKIRADWQKIRDGEMVLYVEFFSFEDDIIKTYEEMMAFYEENAAQISFNEETQELVFPDTDSKAKETAFREQIEHLSAEQAAILGQG